MEEQYIAASPRLHKESEQAKRAAGARFQSLREGEDVRVVLDRRKRGSSIALPEEAGEASEEPQAKNGAAPVRGGMREPQQRSALLDVLHHEHHSQLPPLIPIIVSQIAEVKVSSHCTFTEDNTIILSLGFRGLSAFLSPSLSRILPVFGAAFSLSPR